MKRTLALIGAAALAFQPLWARKAAQVPADEYAEDAYSVQESDDDAELGTAGAESADPYSKEKLRPKGERSFAERLFGLGRFRQVDTFSLFVRSSVGTFHLRKKAQLIHREGTDIAGFYCYYDTSAFAVQMDRAARAALLSAVAMYKDDFEAKRLDRAAKQRRTEAVYGTTEVYEEYGMATANLSHAARAKACFGYEFVKGNPYFSIYVKKAKDLKYVKRSGDDPRMGESVPQRYYFTRAQASRLADFLSDENIASLLAQDGGQDDDAPPDDYGAD